MGVEGVFMAEILKVSLSNTIYLLGTFISFGLVFGYLEKLNNKFLFEALGRAGILITGFIGTIIHETGHYLMCPIFGHKVVEVKLFRPFESRNDNVLGYVRHSYDKSSLYQTIGNFFIGIAPLIFGIIVILILLRILLPDSFLLIKDNLMITKYIKSSENLRIAVILKYLVEDSFKIIKYIFFSTNVTTLRYWIFLFSMYSIVIHMSLSKADLQGAFSGVTAIFIVIIVITFIAKIFGVSNIIEDKLVEFNIFVACFMGIGIFFSIITLGVSFILSCIFN